MVGLMGSMGPGVISVDDCGQAKPSLQYLQKTAATHTDRKGRCGEEGRDTSTTNYCAHLCA